MPVLRRRKRVEFVLNSVDPLATSLSTDSIVGYWNMNESSGNRAGSVGPTMVDGSSCGSTTGKLEGALSMLADGTDYLYVANANMGDLKFTGGSFSIAFWAKTTLGVTGSGESFAAWYDFGSLRAWLILYLGSADQILFDVSANGSDTPSTHYCRATASTVYGTHDPNRWLFIVCTYDDSTGAAAIDIDNGRVTASASKNASTGVYQSSLNLPVGKDAGGRDIQGVIDELGMWSRVLSSDEITYLYNSGTGRTYPFS